MDPGKFLLLPPPPPTESIRAKLGLPPQMDVGPYAYGRIDMHIITGPVVHEDNESFQFQNDILRYVYCL